jgi:hypothetical protein
MVVQGVDIVFGDVATQAPFQRFDILEADETRARRVLANFPRVHVGRPRRKVNLGDASLLKKSAPLSSKDTSED